MMSESYYLLLKYDSEYLGPVKAYDISKVVKVDEVGFLRISAPGKRWVDLSNGEMLAEFYPELTEVLACLPSQEFSEEGTVINTIVDLPKESRLSLPGVVFGVVILAVLATVAYFFLI